MADVGLCSLGMLGLRIQGLGFRVRGLGIGRVRVWRSFNRTDPDEGKGVALVFQKELCRVALCGRNSTF